MSRLLAVTAALVAALAATVAHTDPPARPGPLAAGPVTLVCLGDSLTEGDGDDGGGGYPARMAAWLAMRRPGSVAVNLGKSGWTAAQMVEGQDGNPAPLAAALDRAKGAPGPVVACIWIGSNDLWYLYEYGGEATDEAEEADAASFASHVERAITALAATGATVVVARLDDQSKRPVATEGEAFTAITPAELARMSKQVARYNERIAALAAKHGALTVDFSGGTWFTNPAGLADDGNHPNARGYDAIARHWQAAVEPLLAARR